jgi:hypothetical protein
MKALSDIIGQRGGQVVASLAILAAGALHAPTRVLAVFQRRDTARCVSGCARGELFARP